MSRHDYKQLNARAQRAKTAKFDRVSLRWMYLVDATTLFAWMVAINAIRFGRDWPDYPMHDYVIGFAIATILHITVAYFSGFYDHEPRLGTAPRLPKSVRIALITSLISAALSLGADKFLMPRLNLVAYAVTSALVLVFNRWLSRRVRTLRFGQPRVLLVGNDADIEKARQHLSESDRSAKVVGTVSDVDDLATVVDNYKATDILLLSGAELSKIYPRPLEILERRRVGVFHRLQPIDTLFGVSSARQIASMPFVSVKTHALSPSRTQLKRLLDLLYVTTFSPLILLVFAFCWILVRVFAGGPALYTQHRVGRHGHIFTMVKFRTMHKGAEALTGPVLAVKNDSRVIPALRWMRSTRLDEVPQLWNVFKGDMSIVGPRPERPELVEEFKVKIPGYERRHDIRPGLTGLAQVQGGYHTDAEFKLGFDLQYLVNWTPVNDMLIMAKTVFVVLARKL